MSAFLIFFGPSPRLRECEGPWASGREGRNNEQIATKADETTENQQKNWPQTTRNNKQKTSIAGKPGKESWD
jgi:hypothetical protein